MAREWSGIDALRMDKFLYLVRCYIGKGFEYARGSRDQAWADEGLLEEYLAILEDVSLNLNNGKIPNGIRYHVVDIYVDELDKIDVERDFEGFDYHVQELIKLMPERPSKWSINDREPLDRWHYMEGKVVLLGDAGHAMLPHLGAGV